MVSNDFSLSGFVYGEKDSLLPRWILLVLLLLSLGALVAAGFAAYAHRANARLRALMVQRQRAEVVGLKLAEAVYQSLGDALVLTDEDQRIVNVNQAFTRITGHEHSDLLGQPWTQLLVSTQAASTLQAIGKGLSDKNEWRGRVQVLSKDGATVPLNLFVRVIADSDDRPTRFVLVFATGPKEQTRDESQTA